jgi:hypothetical protein
MRKVTFGNLPLIRVTLRFTLAEPLPMGPAFLFDLADILQDPFFYLGEVSDLSLPGESFPDMEAVQPNRVAGFVLGDGEGLELEAQRKLIAVNWTGTLGGDAKYPSMEHGLIPALVTLCNSLRTLTGAYPTAKVANLYYVNLIEQAEGPLDGSEVLRLIQGFESIRAVGGVLHVQECSYRTSEGIDLRSKVETVPLLRAYQVTHSAGCWLEPPQEVPSENLLSAVTRIHDVLVENFVQSLTEEGKHLWQMQPC